MNRLVNAPVSFVAKHVHKYTVNWDGKCKSTGL